MQDLRSCFFTNEVEVVDEEAKIVEVQGNVMFVNVLDKTNCFLTVAGEDDKVCVAGISSISPLKDPLQAQRESFYDAMKKVAEQKNWEVSFISRNYVDMEE